MEAGKLEAGGAGERLHTFGMHRKGREGRKKGGKAEMQSLNKRLNQPYGGFELGNNPSEFSRLGTGGPGLYTPYQSVLGHQLPLEGEVTLVKLIPFNSGESPEGPIAEGSFLSAFPETQALNPSFLKGT